MGLCHVWRGSNRLQGFGLDLAPVPAIGQQPWHGHGHQPERCTHAQRHGVWQCRAQTHPPDQRDDGDGCKVLGGFKPQAAQTTPSQGEKGGRHIPAGKAAVQRIKALELCEVIGLRARAYAAGVELGQKARILLRHLCALQAVLQGVGGCRKRTGDGGGEWARWVRRARAGARVRRLSEHRLLPLWFGGGGERGRLGVRSGRHGPDCVMTLRMA